MKKTVVTAENINAMIQYQKKQIESIVKEMTEKHKSEIQAISGGLKILEFEYQNEMKRLADANNALRERLEEVKKYKDINPTIKMIIISYLNYNKTNAERIEASIGVCNSDVSSEEYQKAIEVMAIQH